MSPSSAVAARRDKRKPNPYAIEITPAEIAHAQAVADETIFERRMRSLFLRNGGATYRSIAHATGVSIPQARKDVFAALREVAKESGTVEDMVARQVSVLQDLKRANYMTAMSGGENGVDAAKILLGCLDHEAKLFGLYAPARVSIGVTNEQFVSEAVGLLSELEALGVTPSKELSNALNRPTEPADLNAAAPLDVEIVTDSAEPTAMAAPDDPPDTPTSPRPGGGVRAATASTDTEHGSTEHGSTEDDDGDWSNL